MIRLGLRLAVAGGKEAVVRLVLIAAAVAIGGCLLLTTLAGLSAVKAQNARYAWLETGFSGSDAPSLTSATTQAATAGKATWWLPRADYFHGKEIVRIDVAATGPGAPSPPGIPALPAPGEYYASPALAGLLQATPADELADRYPGRRIGVIGSSALPAPESLLIVVGRTAAELSASPGVRLVDRISTTGPDACTNDCAPTVGIDGNGMTLVLSVVVAALLFPVLIFIGGATRLSAARREQRFAAMRLVGATPRQVAAIATVESSVAAVAGVVTAFGAFVVVRPLLATIPFTGQRFFTSDVTLSGKTAAIVAIGIPVAAAVAARLALRRVSISPLGVTRRVTPRPPRAWRLLLLIAGLGELAYFAYVEDIGVRTHVAPTTEAAVFTTGVILTMVGLVVAGPWITMVGSRLTARRANRPASLIAARRIADDPKASFRAVSGLVVAVFVASCAVGIIAAVVAANGRDTGSTASDRGTLVDIAWFDDRAATDPANLQPMIDAVNVVPGVDGVAAIRFVAEQQSRPGPIDQFVTCAELARIPSFGRCPQGASVVRIDPDYGGGFAGRTPMAETVWPQAALTTSELQGLPIGVVVVATDGTQAAIERARTAVDRSHVESFAPETLTEQRVGNNRKLDQYRQLAAVVILASLPIAGCSLAVNLAGGLAERKRPFSLLRLTGTPLGVLRRIVAYETAIPLLIAATVSAGVGMLSAALFLRGQLHLPFVAPTIGYYVTVAAGVAVSLLVVASTFPLLRRVTGPEAARTD